MRKSEVTMPRVEKGILDTSTVILLGWLEPSDLPEIPMITAITLAELAVGPLVATDEDERLARQAHLLQAQADFDAIPFDDRAARAFGAVAANLRRSGRKPAARTYDAMIAATAISRNLPLFTLNSSDFEGIDSLKCINIETPTD